MKKMDAQTISHGVGLARYDAMRRAIAEVHDIDEAKSIRNKAKALEMYARQANDHELERQVREIRIRAERACGELLRVAPKAKGSAQPGVGRKGAAGMRSDGTTALSDLGISKDQSSEWQKLAAVPKEEFEEQLANPVALPTASLIIAAHEAKTAPPPVPVKDVDPRALWLWGRLQDFDRQGLLSADPADLLDSMLDHMKETTCDLAPRVAKWLERIRR